MENLPSEVLLRLFHGDEGIREVFDVVRSCHFCAKDYREVEPGGAGVFITANRRFLEDKRLATLEGIRGKTDFDFYPADLVIQYLAEDWRVFDSGKPLLSQPWLVVEPTGQAFVWISSKFPVFEEDGSRCGIVCVMYLAEDWHGGYEGSGRLSDVLVHIQANLDQSLRLDELAGLVGLSGSQLSRLFRASFGESVGEYIKRVRLHACATKLLSTDLSVAEVAAQFAYFDHSHFTKQFREFFGSSPRDFRKVKGGVLEAGRSI